MTRAIGSLSEVASDYDAIVLDQWGVLHDGSAPYPGVVEGLERLQAAGHRLTVLSNSGKRAAPNAERIATMGLAPELFDTVMTSGEALWRDINANRIPERRFFAVERSLGDAAQWSEGLGIVLCDTLAEAEAILLMGLPDGSSLKDWKGVLDHTLAAGLPMYCSNPDRISPRAGGRLVMSPGTIAHALRERGGNAIFYGKPYRPIFESLRVALNTSRLLMVGDSLEHDISGAHAAGWDSLLVQGGLYAAQFASGDAASVLNRLCAEKRAPAPTYRIEVIK